ncbi:MAG: divergent polysaccharide deacetylase family protein [Aestuariivirga sp.]
MPRDELRQPLRKRSRLERLWAKRPGALPFASVLALACYVGAAAWVVRIPHELAGEPVVTASIPPVEEIKTATIEPAAVSPEEQPAEAEAENEAVAQEQAVEPDPYPEEATIVVSTRRPLKPAPLVQVAEATSDGPLPRISANGKNPFDVYAQTTPLGVLNSGQPRIAIVLGGMGLNTRLTQKAIKELPGDITFGFAPYGEDLQKQVNRARAQGHEIMLQLPMEPLSYPANNPGPNTLLAEATEADNSKALRWHMSRFAGYAGIVNYMGNRFLASPQALRPVLAEMKARGLVFLEDAAIASSSVSDVAKVTGLRSRHADIVIDADPDAEAIQAALSQLEEAAKANGFAVGTGSGLEVTIDTVAEWAKQLESKGILLVPVSATYRGRIG